MVNRIFFLWLCSFLFVSPPCRSALTMTNHPLTDQNQKSFQLYDFKGNYVLVSFIYTRCPMPNMCPLTMTLNKQIYKLLKSRSPKIPVRFLIVTLDPEHDTPIKLKEYAKTHGATDSAFVLATGTPQTIDAFSSELNALGFPSNGLISHNSKTVLLAPDLSFLKDYKDNEWKPEDVWKDIKQLSDPKRKTSP